MNRFGFKAPIVGGMLLLALGAAAVAVAGALLAVLFLRGRQAVAAAAREDVNDHLPIAA
jgi:hypothetical protein